MKSNSFFNAILSLLSVALLISVAFNFILYRKSRYYFYRIKEIRLDPLALNTYPVKSDQQATKNKSQLVAFFGDSRAYEWPSPVDARSFTFMNRGVSGETSVQSAARFGAHIAPLRPQVVVVQIGINDLTIIDLLPERRGAIIGDCKENIERIVSQARRLEATVILSTIFPLGSLSGISQLMDSSDVGEAVDEVNNFIYSLAGEKVIIFDTSAVLADKMERVPKTYSRDLLHLNQAGYEALNHKLVEILALLEE